MNEERNDYWDEYWACLQLNDWFFAPHCVGDRDDMLLFTADVADEQQQRFLIVCLQDIQHTRDLKYQIMEWNL